MMAQQTKSQAGGKKPPEQRSMADAIARAKAAAARLDRARAAGVAYTRAEQRVMFGEAKIPDHPHAKLVQCVTIGMLIAGTLMIVLLPDVFVLHTLAFALMFALLFIGVPHLLLQSNGALSPTKVTFWAGALLLIGAMTAMATGDMGNLWSWAPWFSQFAAGAHPPHHVATPHP
jgi:hypothetical protein